MAPRTRRNDLATLPAPLFSLASALHNRGRRTPVIPATATAPPAMGLCRRAYDEDLERSCRDLGGGTHVMGYVEDRLVSHAMWVTRWLEPEGGP